MHTDVPRTTEFCGKVVAVIGLARSGVACAQVLQRLSATVRIYDARPEAALVPAHLAAVRALGIEPHLADAPVDYAELDVLITSPGVRKSAPVLQGALAAGVPVWGEIEAAYRIARAPILAITGTNGKTTTTVLLAEMLRAAGRQAFVAGNIAAGDIAMPLIQAAWEAPVGAAIVAEISSFQLEWTPSFRPKVAAILYITPDHADRQTWDEYVAAKWQIFAHQGAEDFAVLNLSSFYADERMHDFLNRPWTGIDPVQVNSEVWDFAWRSNPDTIWQPSGAIVVDKTKQVVYLDTDPPEQHESTVETPNKTAIEAPVETVCNVADVKLPGSHNLENIMAAAAMAAAFGVPIEPIRQVATTFTGVVHRLEFVATQGGVRYVNNSMCTNSAAFDRSLEALPEPKVVIAGGVFKGDAADLAQIARAVAARGVRALVLIGASAPALEDAVRAAGFAAVQRAASLSEAVAQSRALAQPGDTVLLAPACASFDMFRDFEDRGRQFKAAVLSP